MRRFLLCGATLFQNQAVEFRVNRDAGKTGEQAISKQTSLAGKDGLFMQAGWDVLKFVVADAHCRFGLRDRDLSQPYSYLVSALVGHF